MRSTASALRSCPERRNYFKILQLTIDGGGLALRTVFNSIHSPANLQAVLSSNQAALQRLKNRKVIKQCQWDLLFPSSTGVIPDSSTFDVSLLFTLLRELCGFGPPVSTSSWDTKPPIGDTSRAADLARIKWLRNELAHQPTTEFDGATFNTYWAELSDALIRLGLDRGAIQRLKTSEPVDEDQYVELLTEWKRQDDIIREKLNVVIQKQGDIQKKFAELVHQTQNLLKERPIAPAGAASDAEGPDGRLHPHKNAVSGGEPNLVDITHLSPENKLRYLEIQRGISNIQSSVPDAAQPAVFARRFHLCPSDIPANLLVKSRSLQVGSRMLGQGNFCEVTVGTIVTYRRGIEKREDVAVKVLKRTATQLDRENFHREAKIMIKVASGVRNNYIVQLRGICFDEDKDQEIKLITELAPKGPLDKYVRNNRRKEQLSIGQLLQFCIQIAEGMAYLAAQNLVHRDLAARNILVFREDLVKISDFGLSRLYSYYYNAKDKESRVPTKWYPPESLEDGGFTTKSDVWSFGVTMWEVFSYGQIPYGDLPSRAILPHLKGGNRLPQPAGCPDEIYRVMERCWQKDHNLRPTFYSLHEVMLSGLQERFPIFG